MKIFGLHVPFTKAEVLVKLPGDTTLKADSYVDRSEFRIADHVFIAATRYLAAHSPTDRARQQTARIALRLHRGDALYEEEAA